MTLLGDFAQSFRAFKTEFRAALWINIKTQNRNLSKVESMNKTLAHESQANDTNRFFDIDERGTG
jgi:hypothetical protein